MKPFNLEAAKEGKPIVTRDGRNVEFVAYAEKAVGGYKLAVLVDGLLCTYPEEGTIYFNGSEHRRDLMMAEEEITVHFNEYENGVLGTPVRDEKHLPTTPKVVKVHTVKIKV